MPDGERRDPTTDVAVLLWCAALLLALCFFASFCQPPR
jgi:hypothetical protein